MKIAENRGLKRKEAKVLMFHRVLPESLITKTNGYSATNTLISQEFFEELVLYLQLSGYQFKTVAELSKQANSDRCIALTFDDGYLDNYEYAFPILQKYNVTATFFPSVSPCRDNSVLPLDIYYQCVEELIQNEDDRTEYYKGDIKKRFYWSEPRIQMEMLKQLFTSFPEDMKVSYMNAQQLKQLAEGGFEIGSHGISHSLLTADYMTEKKVIDELKNSKQWLEAVTHKPVNSFCFPAGRYNAKMIKFAKQVGYTSTCLVSRDAKEAEVLSSYDRINVKQNSLTELKNALKVRGRLETSLRYYLNSLKFRIQAFS